MKKPFLGVTSAITAILAAIFISLSAFPQSASAISERGLLMKALYGGMRECYKDGRMVKPLVPSSYRLYSDAVADKTDSFIVLPTKVDNTVASSTINCLQVFEGVSSGGFLGIGRHTDLKGLVDQTGKYAYDYKDMGYVEGVEGSAESPMKCVSFEYQFTPPGSTRVQTETTNKICFPVDSDGKANVVNQSDVYVEPAPTERGKIKLRYDYDMMGISYQTVGTYREIDWMSLTWLYGNTYDQIIQQAVDSINNLDIYDEGFVAIGSVGDPFGDDYYITATSSVPATVLRGDYGESTFTEMTFRQDTNLLGAVDALRYFTGNSNAGFSDKEYKFLNEDWIALYRVYFQRLSSENAQLRITSNCSATKDGHEYAYFDGNQWCEIAGVETVTEQLGWRKDAYTLQLMSFADITKSYMNLNFEDPGLPSLDPDDPPVDSDPDKDRDTHDVNCYRSTSLGWILCPVLDLVNGAVKGLYGMVETQLALDTDLIGSSASGGSGTYQGWKVFQNFANILVIALLLFVIFSQITGVGIDNYGIKKTLPKLIIAAVLVNISFIVCQVCADLSNIFGSNLNEMFEGFANTVTTKEPIPVFTNIISTVLTGTGIYAAYLIGQATVAIWLPALVLAAVGLLISILFFFILLAVRKGLIVVFIVIAPLALACYMLPNTKKWFDKWVKGFGAMLLVYPICGLAMGVGTWVSKLLMKAGGEGENKEGFVFGLIAALMSVVPFFFIPTLLKNGLSAIGAIGGKIAGMGDRLSSSVKRGIGNSEGFKDAQRRLGMRQNLRTVNRLQAKLDKNGKLSGYQKRRMNNARLAYNKAAKEDLDAEAGGVLLTPGSTGYDAYLKAQESAQSKQNLDNEVARMGDETNNYNPDVMNKQLKDIMNRQQQGKLTPDEELHMRALMYKMATGSGYSKKALAKTVANGTNAEARSAAAKFMSKNGEVASAINSKDLRAGQYLREVNSGQASTDFATWQNTMRDDGMTNAQFVLSKVITDNGDFMGQSASVVASELGMKEVVGADGQVSYVQDDQAVAANIVSDDRLKDMLRSDLALESADSDVRRAILSAAKVRGIAIPQKWSDTPAPAPNPQPQGGRGGRKGKKKRRRMQPGDSGDSGSFH